MKNLLSTTIKTTATALALTGVLTFTYGLETEASFNSDLETTILLDGESGKILHEDNIDQPLPPASMVKMMSEYLVLEAINEGDIAWDDTVSISEENAALSHNLAFSNVMLRIDEEYTVEELYESVAIYSANAATMVLAEHIAGSEGAFVEMMNERGKELGLGTLMREEAEEYGMTDLEEISNAELGDFQFVNSTGLPNSLLDDQYPEGTQPDDDNYMSARATATLAYHLINDYPEVLDTASVPHMTFKEGTEDEISMPNWNKMLQGHLYEYGPMDGLKTGFTSAAGYSFAGTGEKGGQRLISVVMKGASEQERFQETERIMEYGFNNFDEEVIHPVGESVDGYETLSVVRGTESEVDIVSGETLSMIMQEDDLENYELEVQFDPDYFDEENRLVAPIDAEEQIGTLIANYSGEGSNNYIAGAAKENEVPIVTANEVEEAGWFSLTMRSIGGFFSSIWSTVADTVSGWFS
ncbi:D-alanyl-D-alanine carboxypeptidase family protein [Texcoconibacillus texcoconensis]|uniref:serine-type D-Ala-D-Ala carboxypeptidase n=1 Tax=Texcoconibacillus texcoconensis TaxID=1095777 RepID=A0A840QUI5_9BACI|nr:D-alanyl-D-alanine carboxypeptidase family protein [Texcoconibacillus texcoconensis]MBB5174941.1 D-alanyl-D-alanine carboxypeptidase (penicillin-binding protein 5/6) [Texcoconibacillus texcoconensis]